jgi:hypothetical protein
MYTKVSPEVAIYRKSCGNKRHRWKINKATDVGKIKIMVDEIQGKQDINIIAAITCGRDQLEKLRFEYEVKIQKYKESKTELRGFSPQANYTDRAIADCRRN